jgi:hypothetical protein
VLGHRIDGGGGGGGATCPAGPHHLTQEKQRERVSSFTLSFRLDTFGEDP